MPVHPTPGRWSRWLVIFFAAALVGGPIALLGGRDEIARWHVAAGQEKRLNGDLQAAIRSLDRAVAWAPENPALLLRRSRWQIEGENYQAALDDATKALELAPSRHGLPTFLLQRSMALQYVGRHAEAVEEVKRIAEIASPRKPPEAAAKDNQPPPPNSYSVTGNYFNTLAYARALAGAEIEQGIKEVAFAIYLDGRHASYLDTRGFLYYLNDNSNRALADLNVAVEEIERKRRRLQRQLKKRKRTSLIDLRQAALQVRMQDKEVAVLRYHRALAYQAAGLAEKAEKDLKRVRELGFEPNPRLF